MLSSSGLKSISAKGLISIVNKLYGENLSFDDFRDIPEEELRESLVDDVRTKLTELGYNGVERFVPIFSFAKNYEQQRLNSTRAQNEKAIDDYFNNFNKRAYMVNDPVDEYHRMKTQDRFDEQRKDEKTMSAARRTHDDMIKQLVNNKPLLRPLPPKSMKPLKPYAEKLFELQNKELADYLNNCGHEFVNKSEEYLMINEPQDKEKANIAVRQALNKYKKIDDYTERVASKGDDPIHVYHLNKITKLDDIKTFLRERVYKLSHKPFKLQFEVSGVFEEPKQLDGSDMVVYEYVFREVRSINYSKGDKIPSFVHYVTDLDKVERYIESVLFNYSTTASNVKLIYVTNAVFTVSDMIKVTGYIPRLPVAITCKSKFVIVDNVDDKLCWYRFLAICKNKDLADRKFNVSNRTQAARKLLCADNGEHYTTRQTKKAKEIIDNFDGMTTDEMKESAKKNKINVNIFEYNEERDYYDIKEENQWHFDDSYPTFSALLFTSKDVFHIMYIKNVEKLTKLLVCPKCHTMVIRNDNRHGEERMKKHVEHCMGVFTKKFKVEHISKPYCPHILDNDVYAYCLAHGLKWQPQTYYMTYDFETMEQSVDQSCGKSSVVNSNLYPLSVSCCVKGNDKQYTKHFDVRDKLFIPHWIKYMFDQAEVIVDDKIKLLSSMVKINDVEQLNKLDRGLYNVTVLGYNSARFDSNLFMEYFNYELNDMRWKVDNMSMIGTLSSTKQIIIKNNKGIGLRFIDAMAFVSGGTLKQFGKDFGGIDNSNKGVFPYEAINTDNYDEVLSKSEPFEHKDFFSSLCQNNLLTDDEYKQYVVDAKRFANRWEYLLSYNDNDVEMMIKPIDNLIELNGKYGVDMLSNMSLSKNASAIKYALAYKGFDPDEDYQVVNDKNTFKPTKEWWSNKCDRYYDQDCKYNSKHTDNLRNLDNCVDDDDYDKFIEMYNNPETGKCYLCGEHFTYDNKPTLDRIDNNIGHEFSNCRLACELCNKLRSNNDDKITRLRIQIKKYCKLHHLPMTISNEKEYYRLRNGITGGLSNVMHRVNIRGKSTIHRFEFDKQNNTGYDSDTGNVISHVIGIDFNSLYPSSFSSMKHSENPYHGGVMYMPGSLMRVFECYDEHGNKNDEVYQKCLNIINSNYRYGKKKPDFIFAAEVILECPDDLINKFINFPPVFRNFEISNDKDVIGQYMYEYAENNNIKSIKQTSTKLTMTLDTMGKYKSFGCYYLWWLLDHGLVIKDIKSLSMYDCHDNFKPFVTEFMNQRIAILSGQQAGNEKFYKICMNGSYGYDGLNAENHCKIKVCDDKQTRRAILSDSYMGGYPIGNQNYLIESQPKTYGCRTCLQESFFTLDNAKFWYLNFIYDFLFKCLDCEKLHFTSGDTDSVYFAVAGDMNRHGEQGFEAIIKDKCYYDKHVFNYMPNPDIGTTADEKKILGACVEKYGDNQIALCPKCYTIWNDNNETKSLKLKGVSKKTNDIKFADYKNVIDNGTTVVGKNINLLMRKNQMTRVTVNKNALTGFHNKMIVLKSESCAPYINNLTANDYVCITRNEKTMMSVNDLIKDAFDLADSDDEFADELLKHYIDLSNEREQCDNLFSLPTYTYTDKPLAVRIDDNFIKTYNYEKHGTKFGNSCMDEFDYNQTGMSLCVNQCPDLAIIDFDINKSYDDDKRKQVRDEIISKLSDNDVVVKSGSGGLHIYVNHDIDDLYKNAYIKCYACDDYEIDYIACVNDEKRATIMLPGSYNKNGQYQFVRGSYQSVIRRSSNDVLNDVGIKLNLKRWYEVEEYSDDSSSKVEQQVFLPDDEECKLVDGLVGIDVHAHGGRIADERIDLFILFQAINSLSPKNREQAYTNVLTKCNLTDKARDQFDEQKYKLADKHYHTNVLKKIVRLFGL